MARRQQPKDLGEPGKYYFNLPICLNLSLPKDEETTEEVKPRNEPVNLINYRDRTNCRLLSIRNGHNFTPPEKIPYLLEKNPSLKEAQDYIELKRIEGFGEGAIVTRRWSNLTKNHQWPQQWGTVILEHKIPRGGIGAWAPYSVKWHLLGEIEQAWAEDLFVIHASLDDDQLDAIIEAQG